MRHFLLIGILFVSLFASCKKVDNREQENQLRAQKHTDSVFNILTKTWDFKIPWQSAALQSEIADWKAWNDFKKDIRLKPTSSISAFQKRSEVLSNSSLNLLNDIPASLNRPDIKSRIRVLNTLFNDLEMYISLDKVPQKKILWLIPEINMTITSLVNQMDEVVAKKSIPKEVGEAEMLQALDTVRRANPTFTENN
ncbi:hypothetical protein [Flavobacterium sp. JP2137]|uniref:hypothetical protein n=1 Tax=Flavobacterium sp. JP2137 TaxID=3414510 RepID=UPI003D2FE5F1